jgi:hypothetical protein
VVTFRYSFATRWPWRPASIRSLAWVLPPRCPAADGPEARRRAGRPARSPREFVPLTPPSPNRMPWPHNPRYTSAVVGLILVVLHADAVSVIGDARVPLSYEELFRHPLPAQDAHRGRARAPDFVRDVRQSSRSTASAATGRKRSGLRLTNRATPGARPTPAGRPRPRPPRPQSPPRPRHSQRRSYAPQGRPSECGSGGDAASGSRGGAGPKRRRRRRAYVKPYGRHSRW